MSRKIILLCKLVLDVWARVGLKILFPELAKQQRTASFPFWYLILTCFSEARHLTELRVTERQFENERVIYEWKEWKIVKRLNYTIFGMNLTQFFVFFDQIKTLYKIIISHAKINVNSI